MEFQIKLTRDHWRKFLSFVNKEAWCRTWIARIPGNVFVWIVVGIAVAAAFNQFSDLHLPSVVLIACVFFAVMSLAYFSGLQAKKFMEPESHGIILSPHVLRITDDEIHLKGDGYSQRFSWELVQRIERSLGMIYIFIDTAYAILIPANQLDNPDEVQSFLQQRLCEARTEP